MVLKKHSLTLRGHRTSISLEEEFWDELKSIASIKNISLQTLVEDVDKTRVANLSSALRVYILKSLKK